MGLRSAIGNSLVRVGKAFTGPGTPPLGGAPASVPAQMQQAATDTSYMGFEHTFAPGFPIGPYDGYQRHPRQQDFTTGYNIATRPRTFEALSFDTLKGLITNYDVAQIVIRHRIDSLRSLDWKLVAADHYDGDVTDAITRALAVLKKPDRENYFDAWFAKWMRDVLSYDAGTLYRLRNYAGECVGLMCVDGTSVAPLLDYWGQRPQAPAEAYVQYVQGLPWNWLTQDDLIYQPFWPVNSSPYGHAPIEDILLNANTDIRFQLYFLQRFTEGNIPAAFASAPETWTPDQIEQFQEYWDGFVYGDQTRKHQIRWIPGGSSFAWSDEKPFTDQFSLFLMRKTCASFAVVPADLGFTESVNRSSGESQADVQHRVGDLPLIRYAQRILDGFLQDDLGLPLKFQFDLGEEQVDRVQQAQADKVYVDMGAISASKIGEMRYGIADPQTIPRFIMTSRGGPVPVASLMAVAGEIDQATGLPVPGSHLPHTAFGAVEGVLPNPPLKTMSLAERMYGPSAVPPAPPPQPKMTPQDMGLPGLPAAPDGSVAKDGAGEGITSATGIYGDPLLRNGNALDENDDEEAQADEAGEAAQVAKRHMTIGEAREAGREARERELAAFRRFSRARRRDGRWRDFTFEYHSPGEARELNRAAADVIAKDSADYGPPVDPQVVYGQLLANYEPRGIAWVLECAWYGPADIPLGMVDTGSEDSWAASEPGANTRHVGQFAADLEDGRPVSPAVLVHVPGQGKLKLVDGHHRDEAAQEDGVPLRGYTGFPGDDRRWQETHLYQEHSGGSPLNKAAEDSALAFILLRAPNADGKMRYLLQKRGDESPHPGTWGLPGGHAHTGEDPWQAAVREATEEMGALPELHRGPAMARTQGAQTVHTFLVQLERTFTPDMASSATPGESAGWGWFSRGQVSRLDLHPGMAGAWEQLCGAGLDSPSADWSVVSKAVGLGKLPKPEVNYRAAAGPRHCGNCAMFLPVLALGTCELVQGAIDPQAVCDRWQPAEHIPSGGTLGGTALYKEASGYDLNPRSGMISLDLPDELIPAVPGGVDDHHVTVVYLGPDVDDEAFAAACDRAQAAAAAMPGPVEGTVSGTGCFPASDSSDGKVPAWAAIALTGAEPLREALADLSASEFRDWQPHVTRAYLEAGDPLPAPLDPLPVTFTHLSVHRGGQVMRFPFGGSDAPANPVQGDTDTCPCGIPVVYDEANGWQHADGSISHDDGESVSDKMSSIAKAGDPGPKGWPGWKLDLRTAAYWAPLVTAAARKALTRKRLRELAAAYIQAHPGQDGKATGKRERDMAAVAWLRSQGVTVPMGEVAQGLTADAVMIGGTSAVAAAGGQGDAGTGDWQPGDTAAARRVTEALGIAGVTSLLGGPGGTGGGGAAGAAMDMEDGYLGVVSRVLAGWDPEVAASELTGMLETAVADGAYAEALTVTQITSLSARAALHVYLTREKLLLQWVGVPDARQCPACAANCAADPRPAGIPWPSGDTAPEVHPNGRCALVPAGAYVPGKGERP